MKARMVLTDGYVIDADVPSLDSIPAMWVQGTGEYGQPMGASGRYVVRAWEVLPHPDVIERGVNPSVFVGSDAA